MILENAKSAVEIVKHATQPTLSNAYPAIQTTFYHQKIFAQCVTKIAKPVSMLTVQTIAQVVGMDFI